MNVAINPFATSLREQTKQIGLWVSLSNNLEADVAALNQGFTFVACRADSALLAKSVDQLLSKIKSGLQ